jgi:hypothetical protein
MASIDHIQSSRPTAARRADRQEDVSEPAGGMSICRDDDRNTGLDGATDMFVLEVEAIREAIRLQGRSGLRARLEQALQVDGVGLATIDEPARRMADRGHMRILDGGKGAHGELLLRPPLPGVDAGHHPVELTEDDIR